MRVLVVLLLAASCWRSGPAPPPPVTGEAPAPPRPPNDPVPRHSVWRGTYVCSQGLTAVRLTMRAGASGRVLARFDFGPVASNPTVPTGAFEMSGRLRVTARGFIAHLEPGRWIDRPSGYQVVAITIEARGRRMRGVIANPSCRDFKVRRVR